ncbi:MAG TPA: hypothetical protein VFL83_03865 [Anaeromyxobacter sp.]|nr:hypothetical protein [Anaeromyxobacter sp.]
MRRSLAGLAVALLAACVGPSAHTRSRAAGYGHPEQDPSCHGNLSQCLSDTGIERVVVKVGVSREGKLAFLDVLTPELTDADALELRRALEGCIWKPAIGPDGTRVEGTLTLAIQR